MQTQEWQGTFRADFNNGAYLTTTGEKEDPRTVQDMLRHSKVATSLELYTQSTMQQRIAAQEKYLRRILPQNELVSVNGTKNGTGFTGGPLQGYDFDGVGA